MQTKEMALAALIAISLISATAYFLSSDEEISSDEVSDDVEDLNSDEKIIHVLDEFEDEDRESFDLLENTNEDFNSSDENEEVLELSLIHI